MNYGLYYIYIHNRFKEIQINYQKNDLYMERSNLISYGDSAYMGGKESLFIVCNHAIPLFNLKYIHLYMYVYSFLFEILKLYVKTQHFLPYFMN